MLETVLVIYFSVGALVSIPLARKYWKDFRESDHKANTILPLKILNRIVDSYVFMIAWVLYTVLYPIALLELLYKQIKNKKGETK